MKKSILKNPSTIVFLSLCLFFSGRVSGQELFSYRNSPVLSASQTHYAEAWRSETAGEFNYILIDETVLKANAFSVTLPGNPPFDVVKQKEEIHDAGVISWSGAINGGGTVCLVIHNHMITGTIFYGSHLFLVYPLGEGMHLLFKTVPDKFPNDESEEAYQQMIENGNAAAKQPQIHYDEEANEFIDQSFVPGDCKVRIFVAFTSTAYGNMADPIGFVQSCIDATNTAYTNSSVYFQCELARSLQENYTESYNSQTDVDNYRGTSDGNMDDVHALRNAYDADLCVLITENLENGICGRAYDVAVVPYSDGFCVVTRGCAVGNLSFPHELGHLYGCRHDQYVDNTNTPYAYAHGYIYQSGLWRTIMAYNDQCDCSDEINPCPAYNSRVTPGSPYCDRLQYFSNPAVNYNGHAMGVAGSNDNESGLEASVLSIIALQTDVTNKVIGSETVYNGETANLYGTNSITNSSAYSLNNGASGTWKAGTYIDMKTGFWAFQGSIFTASNETCNALKLEDTSPEAQQLESSETGIKLYPNPFSTISSLYFQVDDNETVSVYILNMLGEKLFDVMQNKELNAGAYKTEINGTHLAAGVYFVVVERGGEKSVLKITRME